ncbi:MAG: nicotinate-nucleotide adenylyltransferase [Acidimicrobiales bacterium]
MPGQPDAAHASERAGSGRATSRRLRVGIFGGTFDPPHCGHVSAALACRASLSLDQVLLVVANEPWQKVPQRDVTAAEDRYAMVEAAAAGLAGVEASRMEIDRGGPSYTADTVAELLAGAARAGLPRPDLYLVVGADLVESLPSWKRVDEVRPEVTLAVVSRPGAARVDAAGWRAVTVHGDAVDVSSSEVRERLERGQPVDGLVPDEVMRCIARRSLYAMTR